MSAQTASLNLQRVLKERGLRASSLAIDMAAIGDCPIASAQTYVHRLTHAPPERSKWWGVAAQALGIPLSCLDPDDPKWVEFNTYSNVPQADGRFRRRIARLEAKVHDLTQDINQLKRDICEPTEPPE